VVASLEAARAAMSTEEARSRFLAALVTRLYSEEQLRMLREARIGDVTGLLELDSMLEALTTERLRSAVAALLHGSDDGAGRLAPDRRGRRSERVSRVGRRCSRVL
jgi:hypothetical protein